MQPDEQEVAGDLDPYREAVSLQAHLTHQYRLANTPAEFIYGGEWDGPEYLDVDDQVAAAEEALDTHLQAHPELADTAEFSAYYTSRMQAKEPGLEAEPAVESGPF